MVLIEYEAKDTIVHRLNPLAKLVWFGGMVFLFTLYLEPQPLAVLFALEVFIGCLAKVSWRKLLARAWWVFIFAAVGGYTISVWINQPSQFWNVPPELGCKVLIRLTPSGTPILGYTAITYGGLIWGTAVSVKAIIAVIAACILTFSVPLSDIIATWGKILPYRLSFIATSGIRFYPVMVEKMQDIMAAAKSRGWEVATKNPIKRVKGFFPVIFPAIREATLLADRMALATEARAFGIRKPTSLRQLKFTSSDILFIMFNVFVTGILTYLWWFCGFGKI